MKLEGKANIALTEFYDVVKCLHFYKNQTFWKIDFM